ncbi:site-specific DNA-methyltransferase [Chryseobacterium shandongense]|uniref:site-specific DNA-methyltransferase (adenine-specific) n=1 Tax=Chryseobacterium shandongense TaxID=1493872 RepID=A0AAD0YI74_9FLAO|nr:site-specific DNA-methyltransferase [Chryseobacterium shandongense]AZA88058.1 site-specific DNA-methyltransferase [Chryseobacterium shandongense]AZA96619.1 site-specific DNA-methyltransferase [Chryseobacterium shandongense]
MEKINELTSENIVQQNIERLKEIFPTAFSEGKLVVEELQALVGEYIQKDKEFYQMNWAGKTEAQREANKVSTGTLRPCKEESKDWDSTGNIFIEGDNLEVLKLLQKSYSNKIKMIYIDPPYNTGKDFVYKDNYKDNLNNYLELTGQKDEEGKKLSTNTDSDGRYHSNWLNMMYPRLKLARNLMKDDGVIFISIDNNELYNLKRICDEIFGEENFIECITWNKRIPKNDKGIGSIHENILLYAKNYTTEMQFLMLKDGLDDIDELVAKLKNKNVDLIEAEKEIKKLYRQKGYDRGITLYNSLDYNYRLWGKINMSWPNSNTFGPDYDVFHPVTKKKVKVPDRGWRWKLETFNTAAKIVDGQYTDIINLPDGSYLCGKIWFSKDENTQPSSVNYLDDVNYFLLRSILSLKSDGGIEVESIFEGKSFFSYPKPTQLLKTLIRSFKSELILDFFAGSGTTAHAVMGLNAEDGGNRKCISVQLPEQTEKNSEAFKAGYNWITEISKERIRRAGDLIKQEIKEKNEIENLDTGFRVFKLDSSNIQAWDTSVDKFEGQLDMFAENNGDHIKSNRTEEDVLFEILLKYGLELTLPIEEKVVGDCKIYNIGFGSMYICLSDQIKTDVATAIGEWHKESSDSNPSVIFKDSGFAKDADKTNTVQTLRQVGIENVKSI